MIFLGWLVVFLLVVSFLLILLAFVRYAIYRRYSGARPVTCPDNQQPSVVSIDLHHAAETIMDGSPHLRLSACSLWPARSNCKQDCLAEAIQAEPYTPGRVNRSKKQIYHLPILLAAFAAWYMGMIWHSHYLFRERWIHAVGLTHSEVKQVVWWLSPHLLTAAICLLFAYGVAWLLALSHRKGVFQGVLMSALLCGALIAAASYGIARLPHDLLMIEAGYILLAALTIGVIVGGLYDKLLLRLR